ncbi:MAG: hypothetical protein AAFP28_03295 [Pseudomonadota bacterium]
MLRIEIDGPLKISDETGQTFTPRGAKARGLIALLLMARDFTRPRRYLQDKLWSTREPEQASGSLRQVLSEIRRELGEWSSVLICERGNVQLDPAQVYVVRIPDAGAELFEDIEIRDPAFQSWMRGLRSEEHVEVDASITPSLRAPARSDAERLSPVLVFRAGRQLQVEDQWIYHFLRERIVGTALELGDVDCIDLEDPSFEGSLDRVKPWIFITVDITSSGGVAYASTRLEDATNKTQWRSELSTIAVPMSDESHFILSCIGNHTCQAIGEFLASGRANRRLEDLPLALAMVGREQLFDFSRHALVGADRMLAQAYKLDPKPVYAAWRAFVRNTAMFEHLTADFLEPIDNEQVIMDALREDPNNSMVLAFAAQHSFVHTRDAAYGDYLCKKSIEANDANPISWAFRANYQTALGEYEAAIGSAERGLALASGRTEKTFCTAFSCMARIGVQDYSRATFDATITSTLSPNFMAIRRFLFALHAASNRVEQASAVRSELRTREPDFDQAKLFDSTYPVGTLRSMPIMERL